MIGSIVAVLAAFLYALGSTLTRKNIEKSNFFSISFILSITGGITIIPIALLLTPLNSICVQALPFFMLAGLVHQGLGRLIYFKGMEKIGASLNASIFASYPVFSTLFALVILNESITYKVLVGPLLVAAGAIIIEASIHGDGIKVNARKGLIYPSINALLIGLAYVIKKLGLNLWNAPLMGTAVSYMVTICFYLLLTVMASALLRNSKLSALNKSSFTLFWKPGVALAVATLLSFYALTRGDVSTVVPLIQLEPIFIFVLVKYYLKDIEKVTSKLLVGTIFIISGAIVVSL